MNDAYWRRRCAGVFSAAMAASLVAAAPAGAQQAAPAAAEQQKAQATAPGAKSNAAKPGNTDLDTINVTATKTSEPTIDTLAGASTVTRRDVDRFQPSTVSDLLRNIPGVTTQESQNDPGQSINIRGLQDFGRVNILVDGARQDYQISGHNANGTFYLDPEFIGQADVVRGPVSNIYGSGAIGGVVSFRTRGIEDILNPDENYGVVQRLGFGTNGATFVNSTAAAARIGTVADVFGQLVYRKNDAYKDGGGATVADTGNQLLGGLLKLNYRPSEGQEISATALLQNFDYANNGTSGVGARFKDKVNADTFTLGYKFLSPDSPWINLDTKVYYTTTKNDQASLIPDATYQALGVVPGNGLSDEAQTFGFDVHNTSRFTTWTIDHALTVGGDSAWDHVHTADNAGGFVSALTPSGNRRISGAFIQDEARYGGWLRVLGALRYDDYELSGGSFGSSGSHLSPKLTVGVTPIKGIEFYGTYAEAYRAPSITETLIAGTHPFPAFNILPNPNLKPEVARDLEAGVNVKYDDVLREGDSFRAKANVFDNHVRDYIDFESVGPAYLVPFIPGAPVSLCVTSPFLCFPINSFQYENVAKARLTGAELETAYDWRWGFASIAASYVDGRNETTHGPLQTVPPGRASGTLGLRFLDERLTIGGRVTGVQASSLRVTVPTKSYAVGDLFASYKYDERISGNVLVTNLFNKKYVQFLNEDPSPGLTVKFMLTVKFAAK